MPEINLPEEQPGLFARRPIIGLVMFLVGSLVFAGLAINVITHGPLLALDESVASFFYAWALTGSKFLLDRAIEAYYLGYHIIIGVEVLFGIYFLYKRYWRALIMSVVVLGPGGIIFLRLSHFFNRPRPFTLYDKPIWAGSPNIPGFPSGHAINIVLLCALLLYIFLPKFKTLRGKISYAVGIVLIVLYIGLSRLYAGDHYLTDILAGYAIGFAWFSLTATVVELMFQKYKNYHPSG